MAWAQDSLKLAQIHIIHGSRPKYKYKESEYHMLGGMSGGHVVMQLDSHVYGFLFTHYRFHLFPSEKRSIGMFEDQSASEWRESAAEDRVTTITIPVSKRQFFFMDSVYRQYTKAAPYDYAFIGMRCAASCYKMLADAGILPQVTEKQSVWEAFYPRPLRKKLVQLAHKNAWKIDITAGSERRKWEKDFW
jgi:hypothetical protein